MGTLTLPKSGAVYLDANPIIYTVERHADYEPLLLPLWTEVENDTILAVTSQLTLLETLVKPLRDGNTSLAKDYETLLTSTKIKLEPITLSILQAAAHLRATTNLKTPDSIHAATALQAGCLLLITNDTDYKKFGSLSVAFLKDLL